MTGVCVAQWVKKNTIILSGSIEYAVEHNNMVRKIDQLPRMVEKYLEN